MFYSPIVFSIREGEKRGAGESEKRLNSVMHFLFVGFSRKERTGRMKEQRRWIGKEEGRRSVVPEWSNAGIHLNCPVEIFLLYLYGKLNFNRTVHRKCGSSHQQSVFGANSKGFIHSIGACSYNIRRCICCSHTLFSFLFLSCVLTEVLQCMVCDLSLKKKIVKRFANGSV